MKKLEKSKLMMPLLFLLATNACAQQFIYKPASLTEEAIHLQKIEGTQFERFTKPFEIQRLSENVYWVSASYYNVSVVVGKKGVLLIDAPISRGERILNAIKQITDKPLTALVYSHAHSDHIGGAADILKGVDGQVTIYATKEVKDEIKSHHMEMPAITKVVSNVIDFEGIKIEVDSRLNGHTEDNTLFIINDGDRRILMAIDLIHPDQLEFKLFSLAHDPIKFQTDLEMLMAHKWDVMVTGHGNLAYKADVKFLQTYINDAKAAISEGFGIADFQKGIKEGSPYSWFEAYKDQVVDYAMEIFAKKYRAGREEEFDTVAHSHVEALFWAMFTR